MSEGIYIKLQMTKRSSYEGTFGSYVANYGVANWRATYRLYKTNVAITLYIYHSTEYSGIIDI